MYFHGNRAGSVLQISEPPYRLKEGEDVRMRDRFHIGMYRALLAGAVLTREYLEPLFLASEQGPPGFLGRFWNGLGEDENAELLSLTQADVEYLVRFPVYDLEAGQEKWEPAFGELARWLLDDIETTFTTVSPRSLSGEAKLDAEQVGRLQEVTFFLAAAEHLMDKLFHKVICLPPDEDPADEDDVPPPFPGRVRKVTVAAFGIFLLEEVTMPEKVEDASNCFLVNEPPVREQDGQVGVDCQTPTPWTADVRWVLQILHKQAGFPNLRNGYPSPPPGLRFLDFVLAKFFGARFECAGGSFATDTKYYMMDYTIGFLTSFNLFRDHSITHTTWFFAEDRAPSLSYRRLYW